MEICQIRMCIAMLLIACFTTGDVLGRPMDSTQQYTKKRLHRFARSIVDNSREKREKLDQPVPESVLKLLQQALSNTNPKHAELATILEQGLRRGLEDNLSRGAIFERLFRELGKKLQDSNPPTASVTRAQANDDSDNNGDDYHISTVVRTWSKNDSGEGINDVISGYKTEVNKTKRAGRLSINGALTSLADLLLSENERRDRAETMQLRQRLQFLG